MCLERHVFQLEKYLFGCSPARASSNLIVATTVADKKCKSWTADAFCVSGSVFGCAHFLLFVFLIFVGFGFVKYGTHG